MAEYEIEYKSWEEFLKLFKRTWKPGQHLAVVAPTGAGKTVFVRSVLQLRKYVLALDEKGGDSSLADTGWPRISSWPGIDAMSRKVSKNDNHGIASRYIIGPKVVKPEDFARVKSEVSKALNDSFTMGGWTVYSDEHQLLTDRRMMNLSKLADTHLIAARDKGITFVSSFQAPAWVTTSALRQSYWMAVSYTRDTDTVNTIAERMGRSKAVVRGWVKSIPDYHWIIIGRNPRSMPIITLPTL